MGQSSTTKQTSSSLTDMLSQLFGSTTNQQETTSGQTTKTGGTQQQTLSPLMQQFQNKLLPQIQQGINAANQPVYGQAQIASNLQNLNQLANSSIKSLQGNLARTGGLQGGGQAQGVSDILQNKANQQGQFVQNVPMLNQQAKMSSLGNMFGAAEGALAQAPRGQTNQQTTQGVNNQFTSGGTTNQQTSTGQTSSSGQQTTKTSSPWWQTLLGGLGGALTMMP